MSVTIVSLGEVCDINPKLGRSHDLQDDDLISFVPMAAVDEKSASIIAGEVRQFAEVRRGYTPFADGDVLFAKITPCMENGKAALARDLVGGRGFGSTEFHVLRARHDVIPEWIYYFVRQQRFRDDAKRNFTGTGGQQRVPASFVAQAKLPLPPEPEQHRLVDILSRAEGIVRLRREAQQKAAELIPAIFVDMFGDPGMNPKGWAIACLGDLLAEPPCLGTMSKPSVSLAKWLDLRVANIQGGRLALDDKKWVSLSPDGEQRYALRDGDVILARAIGSLDHLGKAVVVRPDGYWAFDSHLMRIRLDPEKLLPRAFTSFLDSAAGRTEFLKHARRSAVQFNINGKEIRRLRIPVPPISLQRQFMLRLESAESILRQQSEALAKATAAFDALLARTFSNSHG